MTLSRALAPAAVVGVMLGASFITGSGAIGTPRIVVGAPRALTGDEPHYLVMINSLLHDWDLDLGNNYRNAATGLLDAGARFASEPLDHQTSSFVNGAWVYWCERYDCNTKHWVRGESGDWYPPVIRQADGNGNRIERSIHPPGFAWFRALLLWPIRWTQLVEPGALLVSVLVAASAFLVFLQLAETISPSPLAALGTAVIAFLGTPVWHYSRSLYSEIDLMLCAVSAYTSALKWKRPLLAGVLIAVGAQMKPPFFVLVIPLLAPPLLGRRWKEAASLAVPCVAGAGVILGSNYLLYGSPWHPPYPFVFGNPLAGAAGLLFDIDHGVLWTAPAILISALGWPRFLRARPREAKTIAAAGSLYFFLVALWRTWDGGTCFGPRLLVPVLPFAMVGLAFYTPRGPAKVPVWTIALLSIGLNLAAATVLAGVPVNVFIVSARVVARWL